MEPYLEVRNLKKYFKKVKAVDDISFSCGEGELLVILGPSGAGKTTTLKMIAGIVEPTDGEIYLKGELLNPIEPQKRNISMVFEEYALYPHLTVFKNIASPLRIRKMSEEEIKKRVTMIAEMVGIHEHLHKYPSQVSGGQKQRTALARCLVREADLYLLDEPIAHLDAKLRHRMRGEFKRIHKELGKTMVYVTHDFREALALADRIIVLNKGKIEQIGTPEEVFEKPVNTFVATLLDSILIMDTWQWTPFVDLVLLAGLSSIPRQVYEAANVDGASSWQIFWRVTMPLLRPIFTLVVLLRIIFIFKIFDPVYILTGGGPGISTETLSVYTYYSGFKHFNIGRTAALAVLQLVIITIIAQLYMRFVMKRREEVQRS